MRQRLAGLVVLAVAVLAPTGAAVAPYLGGNDLLPDVSTFRAKDVRIQLAGPEKQLRFTTTFENAHLGPLEIHSKAEDCNGNGNHEDDRTAYQRIFADANRDGFFLRRIDTKSRLVKIGCLIYHPGHEHWHLDDFADYHLRSYENGKVGPIVRSAEKVGFCHADEYRFRPRLPGSPKERYFDPWHNGCDGDTPTGDSVGWGEDYEWYKDGQHIDVTALPDGRYCLVNDVDPRGRLAESNERNNISSIRIALVGNTVTYKPYRNC